MCARITLPLDLEVSALSGLYKQGSRLVMAWRAVNARCSPLNDWR